MGRDRAGYIFRNYCEELRELELGDGTVKIFLNMESRNGKQALVELLQYMKHTVLSEDMFQTVDKRIIELDAIVDEVKNSEEWEVVHMTILEKGKEIGKEIGEEKHLINLVYRKQQKGYPLNVIAEHLEITEEEAAVIIKAIEQHPDFTPEELVSVLHPLKHRAD